MKLDAALISYGAGNGVTEAQMFWGDNNTSMKIDVEGTALIPYGTTLFQSSSATGLQCGFERDGELMEACNSAGYCTMIVKVHSPDGELILGQGDSGGPVYYVAGANRYVVGIVKGLYNGWSCLSVNYYGPSNLCTSTEASITPISKILDKLGPLGFVVNTP